MDIFSIFYAALGYLAVLAALLWAIVFVGDGSTPAGLDLGHAPASGHAALIDVTLLFLLAVPRKPLSRYVAPRLERSTQAWATSALLVIVFCAWRPLPQLLWSLPGAASVGVSILFYFAWGAVLIGTLLLNHLDLFELTQGPSAIAERGHALPILTPITLGVLVGVWSTAQMTAGHLLLAIAAFAYVSLKYLLHRIEYARPATRLLQSQRIAR
jgi:methanethiol S-methyltransferase